MCDELLHHTLVKYTRAYLMKLHALKQVK
jgi:hypothetical protein